jgi:hypothetical protein
MTRQFKVGDRVRVRQWEDMRKEFGLHEDGDIKAYGCFAIRMRKLCGKAATVESVSGNIIKLCNQEDNDTLDWDWGFSADMFEEVKPMSRLAEILGVEEGQEFQVKGIKNTFKIVDGRRMHNAYGDWEPIHSETGLTDIINHPEKIKIIQPKPELSESTKAKLRALRVVWPGHEWVAMDLTGSAYIYPEQPKLSSDKDQYLGGGWTSLGGDPFDGEITFDMGPVYYGEL